MKDLVFSARERVKQSRSYLRTVGTTHPGVSMQIRIVLLSVLVAVAGALSASAATACTIHPKAGATDAELERLAKISKADAERIAVTKIRRHAAVSVLSAELETEHSCLLWSFDLRLGGSIGIYEVQVDAGDGRILSVKRESSRQEAAEAKGEAKEIAVK
jgi:uncharacterized membrane protein YkoI